MVDTWLDLPADALEDFEDVGSDPQLDSMLPLWRRSAACRGRSEVMFGPDVDAARAVCADCPVAEQCLRYALDTEDIGVWAGTTFEERVLICPICGHDKPADWLGCTFPHTLLRAARLVEQAAGGMPDVRISTRVKPSARSNPLCVLARGLNHSTAAAHKAGCRCQASVDALREERRRRRGADGPGHAERRGWIDHPDGSPRKGALC